MRESGQTSLPERQVQRRRASFVLGGGWKLRGFEGLRGLSCRPPVASGPKRALQEMTRESWPVNFSRPDRTNHVHTHTHIYIYICIYIYIYIYKSIYTYIYKYTHFCCVNTLSTLIKGLQCPLLYSLLV